MDSKKMPVSRSSPELRPYSFNGNKTQRSLFDRIISRIVEAFIPPKAKTHAECVSSWILVLMLFLVPAWVYTIIYAPTFEENVKSLLMLFIGMVIRDKVRFDNPSLP